MNAFLMAQITTDPTWVIVAALLVFGVVVLLALYLKGDVFAQFSHGATIFKIEAKERQPKKR